MYDSTHGLATSQRLGQTRVQTKRLTRAVASYILRLLKGVHTLLYMTSLPLAYDCAEQALDDIIRKTQEGSLPSSGSSQAGDDDVDRVSTRAYFDVFFFLFQRVTERFAPRSCSFIHIVLTRQISARFSA